MCPTRFASTLTLAGFALVCATGCPLRKEKIKVTADGRVAMNLEYAGTEAELARFDALPSEKTGWKITKTVQQENNGKDKEPTHVIEAGRRFAPGEALPRNFLEPGSPDADLVLDFPTTLRIEQRPDGKYFFFHRVYSPRPWAYAYYWEERFIDDDVKKITAKPVEQLTTDEKQQIVQALFAVEAHRQIEFAKIAIANALPNLGPEFALLARHALLNVYELEEDHLRPMLERCELGGPEGRDACFESSSARILARGYEAFVNSLRKDAKLPSSQLADFERAYVRAKRYHGITNELGGHAFEVEIALPGTITAHNAEKIETSGDEGEQTVTWQFDGKAFRDRPYELIVVSRIPADATAAPEKNDAPGNE